ncbi:MAG: histidine phosphatase family protein [Kofleriaceae bacterium]
MATILLIRHGQASYGQADYDKLSPRGIEQAKLVGGWLATQKIDALFTGPLTRQRETGAYAREVATNLPAPIELAEFAEYPGFDMVKAFMPKLVEEDPELAMLVSKPTRELADKAFQLILSKWSRDEWRIAGVERVHEFTERVQAGLDRVVTECGSGGRVAVVTSAGPIGVATGLVFGATAHHMIRASGVIKNASITELKLRTREFAWNPDKIMLLSFNGVGHLPPAMQTEY